MDITRIDKNFAVETKIQREGLVFFDAESAPFRIYGIYRDGEKFRRLPEAVAQACNPGVLALHANTAGGRVRFVTDSPFIAISAQMGTVGKMPHFPFTGSIGFDLYSGKQYIQTFVPPMEVEDHFEGLRETDGTLREYTVNFPLYSEVKKLYIGLQEGCRLEAAPEYSISDPVVYYGSSITQGGCASRPGCAYQSIITRNLNCDHINLGFSGSAKGEETIAEYISGLKMSVFVYDYDHNAPTPEHLAATHEKMFQTIRAAQPELPILMLTRPKYHLNEDDRQRLEIVRRTYENALAAGDKNVYFIPGTQLLLELVREEALVDNCHPADGGFISMAYVIGEKLKQLLK